MAWPFYRRSHTGTAVLDPGIQARHGLGVGQHDRQLQLCVPLVQTTGESVRLSQAVAGQGVTPLT